MAEEAETVDATEDVTAEAESVSGDAANDKETQDQPKPGTPDKALQKIQQELGNSKRELAEIKARLEAKGSISEADKAKLERAEQRIAKIREFAQDDPIAEHLLELTDRVGKSDTLEKKLSETEQRLKKLENQRAWSEVREKYQGVDVDAIWKKAVTDAGETLGDEASEEVVNRLASRWFEERCDGAKKRLKDDGKPDPKKSAPNQYKVGDGLAAAPKLSEEEEILRDARSLIVEKD